MVANACLAVIKGASFFLRLCFREAFKKRPLCMIGYNFASLCTLANFHKAFNK